MNINSKWNDKKYCSKCEVELTFENWLLCHRENRNYICKNCASISVNKYRENNIDKVKQQQKVFYQKNSEKIKERMRKYCDSGQYVNISDRVIFIKGKKREKPENRKCELCNVNTYKDYHHWDNSNIELAMWLCKKCHFIAEIVERFRRNRKQIKLYLSLQKKIIKNS